MFVTSSGWREDRADVRFHRADGAKIERMFASIERWREDRADGGGGPLRRRAIADTTGPRSPQARRRNLRRDDGEAPRAGLFAILLLTACGEETETTAGASSTMGGSTGGAQAKPIAWDPLPTEGAPEPRYLHTAVWTGSKMLIWGGWVKGPPSVTATGAAYDPEARTWTPIAAGGAPSARHSHTAVWTGSKMLVWGGYSEGGLATEGAIYDPATDAWTPMSSAGQPEPRTSIRSSGRQNDAYLGGTRTVNLLTRAASTIRRRTRGRR
jgi:hypothetical protein